MTVRTPEPRLPLEPEEYPLYRPPRRVGCSALTVITLLTLAAFVFLAWRITPPLAKAITDAPRALLGKGDATPDVTPGSGGLETKTALPDLGSTPASTSAPVVVNPPTATPAVEYVKIANTGGQGVRLYKEPKSTSTRLPGIEEGAILKIIGPDTVEETKNIVWRHVQLTSGDQRSGYVSSKWLIASGPPTP